MPVDIISGNPKFTDLIRIPIETRIEGSPLDPDRVEYVEIWYDNDKIFSLGPNPWIKSTGGALIKRTTPLAEPIEGEFYLDINPYRYGIRKAGTYTVKWSSLYDNKRILQSIPLYLEESDEKLPKELWENIRVGDLVRIRFTIKDPDGNLRDPEFINRLTVYRTPHGPNPEAIETRVILSVSRRDTSEHIWTRSRFLSGQEQLLIRESKGEFYFDWETGDSSQPGRCLALIFYRNQMGITPIRGNSWEIQGTDIYLLNSRYTDILDPELFERMYTSWIPNLYKDLPKVEDQGNLREKPPHKELGPVSKRLLTAYGKAAKDLFDWSSEFQYIYDPDRTPPHVLPSLASNVGWFLKGESPTLWRGQVYRSQELLGLKGTFKGMKGFIEVMGGRIESLTRYWQVTSRNIQRDYFKVDEELCSFNTFNLSKSAYLYSEEDPYRFLSISHRKVIARSSDKSYVRFNRGESVFNIFNLESARRLPNRGDRIRVEDRLGYKEWYEIDWISQGKEESRTIVRVGVKRSIDLRTTTRASYIIAEENYRKFLGEEISQVLNIDTDGLKIKNVRWNIDTQGILIKEDDIILSYQCQPLTNEQAEIEEEILGLPLADMREEREIEFPLKNFNARLLEDPGGYWTETRVEESFDSTKINQGRGINLNEKIRPTDPRTGYVRTILTNNRLVYPGEPYLPISSDEIKETLGRIFFSAYGDFYFEGSRYYFLIGSRGGRIGSLSGLLLSEPSDPSMPRLLEYSDEKNFLEAINLSGEGIEFVAKPDYYSQIFDLNLHYSYQDIEPEFHIKDYLTRRRDRICPFGIENYDPLVFGFERTTFPYSENVYNMDEYNGSLRPSYEPCYIGLDFIDPCNCTPTTWISMQIKLPTLAQKTIEEFKETIKESKPFHTQVHSLSFSADFKDSLILSEQLELIIKIGLEDHVFWVNNRLRNRDPVLWSYGRPSSRNEYIYLKQIQSSKMIPLMETSLTLYIDHLDINILDDTSAVIVFPNFNLPPYRFKKASGGILLKDGLGLPFQSGDQIDFTIYQPISFSVGGLDRDGIYGGALYGISEYGNIIHLADTLDGRSTLVINGLDIIKNLGVRVGDFLKLESEDDDTFFEIKNISIYGNGTRSEITIETPLEVKIYPISLWRSIYINERGTIDRLCSSFEIEELTSAGEYLAFPYLGTQEKKAEVIKGPLRDSARVTLLEGPVNLGDNYEFDSLDRELFPILTTHLEETPTSFTIYGYLYRDNNTYEFFISSDSFYIGPPGSGVSSIVITEEGLLFSLEDKDSFLDKIIVWYHYNHGSFYPLMNIQENKWETVGFSGNLGQEFNLDIYKIIPTGISFNPRTYLGDLPPPYSLFGKVEIEGQEYSFVTKSEGGVVGVMSDIYPAGSGVEFIKQDGTTIETNLSSDSLDIIGLEFAGDIDRSRTDSSLLFVKISDSYPYFNIVSDRLEQPIEYSLGVPKLIEEFDEERDVSLGRRVRADRDKDEMFFSEKLEVEIYDITDPDSYNTWLDSRSAADHNRMITRQSKVSSMKI